MPGAALPPREPEAGSTIPSLPLRRLLLAGPERELPPPGSQAASFSCFSRPTSPESRPREDSNPSRSEEVRGEQALPPHLQVLKRYVAEGTRHALLPPVQPCCRPRKKRRGCGTQTCKLALEVSGCSGTPSRFPTASTSRRVSLRR